MNKKRQCSIALMALVGAFPAVAQENESRNPFSFSASQTFLYDSNIYRLSDDVPKAVVDAYMKGKRSDILSTTRLGVNFDGEYSRQGLHAGVSVARTLYRTHSQLNNTSPDARARWDWRIGDRLSGTLGYSYSEAFVGFSDTYNNYRIKQERVMRRLGRANFSADYWWHPDWAVGFGISDVRNSYADNLRPYDEYNAQSASLNVTFRPSTGNRIVLSLSDEEGRYPNRDKKKDIIPPKTESLRDWSQRNARLSGLWQLTGVTRLSGYVGYTQRKYDLAPRRDFSGVTGSLAFRWTPVGKAIIDLSWRREVGADIDAVSNYAVSQGWSLQPAWLVTSKVRIGASVEYLDRDYGGVTGGSHPRDAKSLSYGLNIQYAPTDKSSITLGAQREERDAKAREYDFTANTVWLSGSIAF